MPGNESDAVAELAVSNRNADTGRGGNAAGDAGNYFNRNSSRSQGENLLAAPAEKKRVAALEAGNGLALFGQCHHHAVDEMLRRGFAAAALAYLDDARLRRRLQQLPIDLQSVGEGRSVSVRV